MEVDHKHKFASIILAAGKGVRMRSNLPKVMHKLAGQPLIAHVLTSLLPLEPEKAVTIIAPNMDEVRQAAQKAYPSCMFAVQDKQLGTGHAVQAAADALAGFNGTILILFGDTPLITSQTLDRMLEATHGADIVVLGMNLADPTGYGRLVVGSEGRLEEIVECRDANAEQKRITLCNSGVMAVHSKYLFYLLERVEPINAAGEYYLTHIVTEADAQGLHCKVVEANADELIGINSRHQLAEAERAMQKRLRTQAIEQGATLIDPDSVYFSADTKLGQDVLVHPQVVFSNGVVIGDNVEIRSFSHLEGCEVRNGASVGPFARIRPGSVIGEDAHIGNFVELKKTTVGKGAKASHLSYIGDAEIGDNANIGAGTITCNYDGINKHKTIIGEGAFIGSNTSLVAPVTIGKGAIVGASSVITENVEDDALAMTRSEQVNKPGKGREFRQKKQKSA